MKKEIKILDGIPKDFKALYWLNDYKKFGVIMEYLYNPFNHWIGIYFKKEELKKSIIIPPNFSDESVTAKKFLEIEKIFGIPIEKSKYKGGD